MNKLFTKLAAVVLGATMATGVGVAVASSSKANRVEAASESETYTLTGFTNQSAYTGESKTYSSVTASKGSGSTAPTYYSNGTATRFYTNNTVVVAAASGRSVTGITLTSSNSTLGNFSASGYSSGTWSGTASSVTFTVTAAARLTQIVVTTDVASSNPSLSVDKTEVTVAVGSTATFTVTSANLTSNFSVTGGNSSYFTTSYTASSADGDHVVTLSGVAPTSSPITLTIASTGATSKTVDVSVETPTVYEKVIAASSLKSGKQFYIGSADGAYVLGKYVSGNNCTSYATTPDGDGNLLSTNLPSTSALFTLGGSSGAWTLTDQDSNIYYGTSGQNYLKSSSSATDTWSISVTAAGVATITSAASTRSIKKNTTSPLFSTYASGQSDVSIYMVPSVDPELQVLITGSTSLGIGESATLTANKLNGASGTVSWATSNSSILSLSAASGDSVTVTAGSTTGSATITASLSGCDDVETEFTVRKGSATVPYTVAEAMAAVDGSDAGAKTGVYVSGIVSQVDSLNGDNSITYWISANGTTTDQMEVYKGFGLSGATFSDASDLQVGDEVVVHGNITYYTSGSIYEFSSGSELYSFNRPVTTLASITAIEGTLEAKAGDAAWDLSGLSVKGTMSGSATIVDVTLHVNLTTDDVPGTPASTTTRNVSVTATGKDDSSITLTQNVSGTVKVDSGLVDAGNYRISATRDSVTYYLKQNGTSSAPSAVTDFREATVFTFTLVADDTYTISNGSSYLYTTDTNNGVRFGTPSDPNNKNWTIETGESTLDGSYNLVGCSGARFLTLYNAADWRAYNSATASNRKENTDLQAFDADQYSTEFLTYYTAGCNAEGGYDSASMEWDTASAQFALLASDQQIAIKGASAVQSGTLVQQCAARYDYIVGKYGTGTFADFMTRNPVSLSSSRTMPSAIVGDSNTVIMIIVIGSLVSVSAIGGYFFLRKRREHN